MVYGLVGGQLDHSEESEIRGRCSNREVVPYIWVWWKRWVCGMKVFVDGQLGVLKEVGCRV